MTLGEMCIFYEHKNEHYPVSDEFIKKGYGQKQGGYIRNARKAGYIIATDAAEPNQKWHLLKSYLLVTDENVDARKCYNRIICPELLLWLGEAVGLDVSEAARIAMEIIDRDGNGIARNVAGRKIKEIITWDMIEEKIVF